MLNQAKLLFERFKYLNISDFYKSGRQKTDVNNLLSKKGYVVLEDYWSLAKCARVKGAIDTFVNNNNDTVQWDTSKTDARITGSENKIPEILDFHNDKDICDISKDFYGENTTHLFTLAGRMRFNGDNLGSGNGWHRDAFAKQFKAMLYLSDVSNENGPFQYVEGTNNYNDMKELTAYCGTSKLSKRFSPAQTAGYLREKCIEDRLRTFTGRAGTLILFDSSGLHRGMPMMSGERHALTIYAMRSRSINDEKYNKFGLTPK